MVRKQCWGCLLIVTTSCCWLRDWMAVLYLRGACRWEVWRDSPSGQTLASFVCRGLLKCSCCRWKQTVLHKVRGRMNLKHSNSSLQEGTIKLADDFKPHLAFLLQRRLSSWRWWLFLHQRSVLAACWKSRKATCVRASSPRTSCARYHEWPLRIWGQKHLVVLKPQWTPHTQCLPVPINGKRWQCGN